MDLGDSSLQVLSVLGAGAFGRVYLCKNRSCQGKDLVCVKRIAVRNPKEDMKMIEKEIYIISQLKHPHIVRFRRWYTHQGTANIVMDYLPNGTLRDVLAHNWRDRSYMMPVSYVVSYFCDMLMGLEYLHIRHVMHRDLKPENLLVDGSGRIKIADFGISAIHNPNRQQQNICGTPHYMAPEVMESGRFEFKSDIWSLGCVLYEICMGYNPFRQAKNYAGVKTCVQELARKRLDCGALNAKLGGFWPQLIERMITFDLRRRIALPDIPRMDALLTKTYYRQYFEYY